MATNTPDDRDRLKTPVASLRQTPPAAVPAAGLQEVLDRQNSYQQARYNVALGVLLVAPALALLPPRKLDLYTFGLAGAWAFCLGEVTHQHGTNVWHIVTRTPPPPTRTPEEDECLKNIDGWRGERVLKQHREREGDGKGIGEMIMESVWDVWEQKDKADRDRDAEERERQLERLDPVKGGIKGLETDEPLVDRIKRVERENADKRAAERRQRGSV